MMDSSFKTSGAIRFKIYESFKLMIDCKHGLLFLEYLFQYFQNPKSMMTKKATDNAPSK